MKHGLRTAGIAVALLAGISSAGATPITYSATGSGSDGALAASADFTPGAGVLAVTLTNQLAANVIRSQGQALSDISFTLSGSPGTLGTTSGASGQFGNIGSGGGVTGNLRKTTPGVGGGGGQHSH